jgi:hypothetical protein
LGNSVLEKSVTSIGSSSAFAKTFISDGTSSFPPGACLD